MAKLATDFAVPTRICEFARRLHQLHRLGNDDAIEGEFNAVCRAIWGYTLDDFTDDDLSAEDHAWLDQLTRECAVAFAADQGYDLKDYVHGGLVADWWGFTWMILAEARGVLTPEKPAISLRIETVAPNAAPWLYCHIFNGQLPACPGPGDLWFTLWVFRSIAYEA